MGEGQFSQHCGLIFWCSRSPPSQLCKKGKQKLLLFTMKQTRVHHLGHKNNLRLTTGINFSHNRVSKTLSAPGVQKSHKSPGSVPVARQSTTLLFHSTPHVHLVGYFLPFSALSHKQVNSYRSKIPIVRVGSSFPLKIFLSFQMLGSI